LNMNNKRTAGAEVVYICTLITSFIIWNKNNKITIF